MSRHVQLELGDATRQVAESEFPLMLGGERADVPLRGGDESAPSAYLGITDGELFLQPNEGAPRRASCNGAPVQMSQWLRSGDVVRIGGTQITFLDGPDGARLSVEDAASNQPIEPSTVGGADSARTVAATPIAPVAFEPRGSAARGTRQGPKRRRSFGRLAIPALLVAFTSTMAFLLSARSVEIRVEPVPDHIAVSGGIPRLRLGGRFLVRPGRYHLVAEKQGYRRLASEIEVTAGASQSFAFRMSRLPGRLAIDVGGVEGAVVAIDGAEVGATPLDPVSLEAGEHDVLISSPRHAAFATRVGIDGMDTEQTLAVALEPRWADVSFDSEPRGARVRLGGESLGRTPVTAEILDGAYRVTFTLAGYKPRVQPVSVVAQQPQTVPRVRLTPSGGNLVLTTEPTGAAVQVDGRFRGQAPLDLDLSPGQTHQVRLSKAGYGAKTVAILMRPQESRALDISLEPRLGDLRIAVNPADAEVVIDGQPRRGPLAPLRLTARAHTIEVRKPGFDTYRTEVIIRPDFLQSLEVRLVSQEEARAAERPARVVGSEGHELRLITGGRFRMGAPRREPGRRANEVLRDVELTRPFYLATQEVSNRQFRRFKKGHRSGALEQLSLETDHHPVVRVTWEEAAAYCNWLSQRDSLPPAYVRRDGRLVAANPMTIGYRLPTEAEWAWVARYAGSEKPRKFPWGSSLPVAKESGNFADASARGVLAGTIGNYNDGYPATAPTEAFRPNPLGLRNLGGNVAEWVHDLYGIPRPGGPVTTDSLGPTTGEHHVIRGSSWMHSTVTQLRLSYRDYGDDRRPDVGFRVARYAK